jgi:hypothetical protein
MRELVSSIWAIYHRDEGGAGAEEAHLDAYVLAVVLLIYEEVVNLTHFLARLVVDFVTGEAVLQGCEPEES